MIATLAKSSMVGLLAASAPVETTDTSLWFQWGLAGVVVAYVLWRDWERETRMAAAIDSQQKWVRETLLGALERNAAAMERVAAWMERQDSPSRPRRLQAVNEDATLTTGGDHADLG